MKRINLNRLVIVATIQMVIDFFFKKTSKQWLQPITSYGIVLVLAGNDPSREHQETDR